VKKSNQARVNGGSNYDSLGDCRPNYPATDIRCNKPVGSKGVRFPSGGLVYNHPDGNGEGGGGRGLVVHMYDQGEGVSGAPMLHGERRTWGNYKPSPSYKIRTPVLHRISMP
jgi:hypothetical protein